MKEEYEYDPFLDISIYPILMQLKDYFDGIQHCVIVVGKGIFDSNFSFELPLTKDNSVYYCIYDDLKRVNNYYKGLLKAIRLSIKEDNKRVLQK